MAVDYICSACGGNSVTRDAWAEWEVKAQDWVLGATFDYAYCHDCDGETRLEEVELDEPMSPEPSGDATPLTPT